MQQKHTRLQRDGNLLSGSFAIMWVKHRLAADTPL
jgi:hypothetical protein